MRATGKAWPLHFQFYISYSLLFPFCIPSIYKIIHLITARIPNYPTGNKNKRGRNKKRWHYSTFFHTFTLFSIFFLPKDDTIVCIQRRILGDFKLSKSTGKNPPVNLQQFILHTYGKVHLAWTFSQALMRLLLIEDSTRIQTCKTPNMGKANYGNKNQACIIPLKLVTALRILWPFFFFNNFSVH